jgi:hypothetical protein
MWVDAISGKLMHQPYMYHAICITTRLKDVDTHKLPLRTNATEISNEHIMPKADDDDSFITTPINDDLSAAVDTRKFPETKAASPSLSLE